jgi:hypothetical protein
MITIRKHVIKKNVAIIAAIACFIFLNPVYAWDKKEYVTEIAAKHIGIYNKDGKAITVMWLSPYLMSQLISLGGGEIFSAEAQILRKIARENIIFLVNYKKEKFFGGFKAVKEKELLKIMELVSTEQKPKKPVPLRQLDATCQTYLDQFKEGMMEDNLMEGSHIIVFKNLDSRGSILLKEQDNTQLRLLFGSLYFEWSLPLVDTGMLSLYSMSDSIWKKISTLKTEKLSKSKKDEERTNKDSTIKRNLTNLRSALTIFISDHEGDIPYDIRLLKGPYISQFPEVRVGNHPLTDQFIQYDENICEETQNDFKQLKDTGQWGYTPCHGGRIFIDCTHKDEKGTPYYEY